MSEHRHATDEPRPDRSDAASDDAASSPSEPQTDDAATPAVSNGPGEGHHELDRARAEVADLQDRLRRSAADLDNLRKRHVRERDRERLLDRSQAAQVWLPVVDNLELALEHAPPGDDAFVTGIRAVHQQAIDAMARLGFPRMDPQGEVFDATVHEAVSSVPDAEHAGHVLATARPGYGSREALLRPAQVVVAVAPPAVQD